MVWNEKRCIKLHGIMLGLGNCRLITLGSFEKIEESSVELCYLVTVENFSRFLIDLIV